MPNYVTNIFIEVGDENKYNKFVVNKKHEVDFNKLILMPSTLYCGDTCVGTMSGEYTHYFKNNPFTKFALNTKTFKQYQEMISSTVNFKIPRLKSQSKLHSIPDRDTMKVIEQAYTTWNIIKYDYPSWYEWANDKWGCKWNATTLEEPYPCLRREHGFTTAWRAPFFWLEELAKHLDFVLLYADEDIGSNCGIIQARQGTCVVHDNTSYLNASTVFACLVNGHDLSEFDADTDEELEEQKYIYENRYIYLEEFFEKNNCLDIYERNKSVLDTWF